MFVDPLVNLFADEVEPSVDFYTRHFGFTETFRTPRGGVPVHVELVLETLKIAISARSAGRTNHGLELLAGPPQVDLVFWCEDADAAYSALLAAGVSGVVSPHDSGPNRTGFLTDPAGHLVSVVPDGLTLAPEDLPAASRRSGGAPTAGCPHGGRAEVGSRRWDVGAAREYVLLQTR